MLLNIAVLGTSKNKGLRFQSAVSIGAIKTKIEITLLFMIRRHLDANVMPMRPSINKITYVRILR